jgi:hypothetical protein
MILIQAHDWIPHPPLFSLINQGELITAIKNKEIENNCLPTKEPGSLRVIAHDSSLFRFACNSLVNRGAILGRRIPFRLSFLLNFANGGIPLTQVATISCGSVGAAALAAPLARA